MAGMCSARSPCGRHGHGRGRGRAASALAQVSASTIAQRMAHQGNRHLARRWGSAAARPGPSSVRFVVGVPAPRWESPAQNRPGRPLQAAAAALQAPAVRCRQAPLPTGQHLEARAIPRNADLAREGLVARRHIANGQESAAWNGDQPANARPSAGAAAGCVQAAGGPGWGGWGGAGAGWGGWGWPWASCSRQARRGELPAPPRQARHGLALRKRSMNCSAVPTADSGSSGMSMHHHHGPESIAAASGVNARVSFGPWPTP